MRTLVLRDSEKRSTEHFFHVYIASSNTRGFGRILECYANPRLRLGFACLSRALSTLLVFRRGYVNTEKVLLKYRDNLNNRCRDYSCIKNQPRTGEGWVVTLRWTWIPPAEKQKYSLTDWSLHASEGKCRWYGFLSGVYS